jgi:5-methylcytosine-specific restriction endonuclease McrA
MSNTLLLNQNYEPISVLPLSVIDWRHAIKLYFLDRVTILESYDDWVIRSEHLTINVPSVCVTKEYFNYKKNVKFSRSNLFLRDLYTCQYCDEVFEPKELTLDHVIPRMAGGKTNWENSVTACKDCNSSKGHQFQRPLREPYKPDYYHLVGKWKNRPIRVPNAGWYKYLGLTHQEQDVGELQDASSSNLPRELGGFH